MIICCVVVGIVVPCTLGCALGRRFYLPNAMADLQPLHRHQLPPQRQKPRTNTINGANSSMVDHLYISCEGNGGKL